MDLVLINPNCRTQVYQSLGKTLAACEPPIWAATMAAFVRNHGFQVAVIDANAEQLSHAETARRAIQLNPRLIGVVAYGHQPSASTQVMPAAEAVCEALDDMDCVASVILLGGHVAALPEMTLQTELADCVAGGEGLWTLVDMLRGEREPRGLYQRADFKDKVVKGPPAPLVSMQEMPFPAWDLLPMHLYRAHNWHCFGGREREPYAALYTTWGCPYSCSFCCIQSPFRDGEQQAGTKANSYRRMDPARVVAELQLLHTKYGVRNVKIADEMFVLNRGHVESICDGIIARGLDLNIWAYARIDTIKDGILPKLKRAGFNWLAFGIESADAGVRHGVDKDFRQESIYSVVEEVRKHGISVGANYIFGLPEDTLETMQHTLQMAIELNTEWANFYCTQAYPGSPLYEQVRRERPGDLPATWSGYSQHSKDSKPLPTKHLTSDQVLRFRDEAFVRYFDRAEYLYMIAEKFGQEAVAEVRHMLGHTLERDYQKEAVAQ